MPWITAHVSDTIYEAWAHESDKDVKLHVKYYKDRDLFKLDVLELQTNDFAHVKRFCMRVRKAARQAEDKEAFVEFLQRQNPILSVKPL